jgi:hypothetical protein
MEQIASTFDSVGIPGGFHLAAAEIYSRLSGYKDLPQPGLDDYITSLLNAPQD